MCDNFQATVTLGHVWQATVTLGHVWQATVTLGHVWQATVTLGQVWQLSSNCHIGACVTSNCHIGACVTSNCHTGSCVTSNCHIRACVTSNCHIGACVTSNCHIGACVTSNCHIGHVWQLSSNCHTGPCVTTLKQLSHWGMCDKQLSHWGMCDNSQATVTLGHVWQATVTLGHVWQLSSNCHTGPCMTTLKQLSQWAMCNNSADDDMLCLLSVATLTYVRQKHVHFSNQINNLNVKMTLTASSTVWCHYYQENITGTLDEMWARPGNILVQLHSAGGNADMAKTCGNQSNHKTPTMKASSRSSSSQSTLTHWSLCVICNKHNNATQNKNPFQLKPDHPPTGHTIHLMCFFAPVTLTFTRWPRYINLN